jgi:hypothetical protein
VGCAGGRSGRPERLHRPGGAVEAEAVAEPLPRERAPFGIGARGPHVAPVPLARGALVVRELRLVGVDVDVVGIDPDQQLAPGAGLAVDRLQPDGEQQQRQPRRVLPQRGLGRHGGVVGGTRVLAGRGRERGLRRGRADLDGEPLEPRRGVLPVRGRELAPGEHRLGLPAQHPGRVRAPARALVGEARGGDGQAPVGDLGHG